MSTKEVIGLLFSMPGFNLLRIKNMQTLASVLKMCIQTFSLSLFSNQYGIYNMNSIYLVLCIISNLEII
jgi:hypothetical protein